MEMDKSVNILKQFLRNTALFISRCLQKDHPLRMVFNFAYYPLICVESLRIRVE